MTGEIQKKTCFCHETTISCLDDLIFKLKKALYYYFTDYYKIESTEATRVTRRSYKTFFFANKDFFHLLMLSFLTSFNKQLFFYM